MSPDQQAKEMGLSLVCPMLSHRKLEKSQPAGGMYSNTNCVLICLLLEDGTSHRGTILMRVHKVNEGCQQVGGTIGTGVLWWRPVSSWGVPWSMCLG